MENAFNKIKQSIEKAKSISDLKACYKMVTSFKRYWKFSLGEVELEEQLIELIIDKQEILCQ